MLKSKDGNFFVTDQLRNRNTIEFLGIWEELHNPNFNYGEFAIIKSQSERLERLNKIAISQMRILSENDGNSVIGEKTVITKS